MQREEVLESFKQEALASWANYQETGRHLTGGELHAWLNNWGTDKAQAAPECHD
jgi:predicted transcriptional regulator